MIYYHGGFPGMQPGDQIEPAPPHVVDGCPVCVARAEGRIYRVGEYRQWLATLPNQEGARLVLQQLEGADDREPVDPPSKPDRVYITSYHDYARWYAARSRGDLYEVQPDGNIEESDEDNFPSWTSGSATVTRVVERRVMLDRKDRRKLMREWDKRDRQRALLKTKVMDTPRRIYAIGDVHGHSNALFQMIMRMEADGLDTTTDKVVFLGDYVDRGSASHKVITQVRTMVDQFGAIALRGNHEQMMIDAHRAGPGSWEWDSWWHQGGRETAVSFSNAIQRVPSEVIDWAGSLPLTVTIGRYDFVHAGFLPQENHRTTTPDETMLWIREEFLESDYDFGNTVVHGHTPGPAPVVRPNRIGIDTLMVSGNLTAVCLEQGREPRFLEASIYG